MDRAKELDRCVNCLTPWKTSISEMQDSSIQFSEIDIFCMHCANNLTCVFKNVVRDTKTKESQTEDNMHLVQECETELEEGKAIIENQSRQIEELNNKILSLENKWKILM